MSNRRSVQSTSDLSRHFPQLALLPAELRREIWVSTLEPRLVVIRQASSSVVKALDDPHVLADSKNGAQCKRHIVTKTPTPTILQLCHKTRHLGLYKRVSMILDNDFDIQSQSEAPYV